MTVCRDGANRELRRPPGHSRILRVEEDHAIHGRKPEFSARIDAGRLSARRTIGGSNEIPLMYLVRRDQQSGICKGSNHFVLRDMNDSPGSVEPKVAVSRFDQTRDSGCRIAIKKGEPLKTIAPFCSNPIIAKRENSLRRF